MIQNYLKTTWRNLLRSKIFSLINILGLALGIAACLMILQYVRYERSYDSFHTKGDRIYRVGVAWYHPNGELEEKLTGNFGAAGPAIRSEIPEVEAVARFRPWFGSTLIKYDSIVLPQERIYFADPDVFDVFSFPVLLGDATSALEEANSAVISESVAHKYFGTEDPIGKVIELQQGSTGRLFTVKGMFQDVPDHSHFHFDVLLSYKTLGGFAESDWGFSIVNTYLLLQPHADALALEDKLQQVLRKYRETAMENSVDEVKFITQPLRDIYLYSDLRGESVPTGNGKRLNFIVLIAILILLIAYANYINLTTARAMQRAKEVGVRKAAGAQRATLVMQFLQESFVLNALAVVVALALVQVLQQPFSLLTGQPASLAGWNSSWLLVLLFLIAGPIVSGFYPAFVLSSFKPVTVLKGSMIRSGGGSMLRKYLVVFQFATSVGLIAVTLIVHRQLAFMQDQELGFDAEQIVILEAPVVTDPAFPEKAEAFKNTLASLPGIRHVAASSDVPGRQISWSNDLIHRKDAPHEFITSNYILGVDHNFVETYGMEMVAGRNFDENFGADKQVLIINEKAAYLMGFESPEAAVGEAMVREDVDEGKKDLTIIGVLRNFHQLGLQHAYDPMILTLEHHRESFYSCKIQERDMDETLQAIGNHYAQFFPGNPFSYLFMYEFFNLQYQSDKRFGQVFFVFSGLAILVACLGLYGLVAFTTTQHTKEIGIRKVLGASVQSIVALLSVDFLKLVVIASLLALPLTYIGMQRWLEGYAFRTDIGAWLLILPVGVVVLVALITVSFQTVRAAMTDPVKALHYE